MAKDSKATAKAKAEAAEGKADVTAKETAAGEPKPDNAKPTSETTASAEKQPDGKEPGKSKERDTGYSHAQVAEAREKVMAKTGKSWPMVAAMNDHELFGEVARLEALNGVKADDAKS